MRFAEDKTTRHNNVLSAEKFANRVTSLLLTSCHVFGRFGSFGARDYRKQHAGFGRARSRATDDRSAQGNPKWQPRSKSSSRVGSWGDM